MIMKISIRKRLRKRKSVDKILSMNGNMFDKKMNNVRKKNVYENYVINSTPNVNQCQ